MQPTDVWAAALNELQLQMTQATFDTWLHDSRLATHEGNTYTIQVKNRYAKDWLENRLLATIKRTLARLTNGPVQIKFTVAYPAGDETMHTTSTTRPAAHRPGEIPPDELDRDQPPDCRYSVELVHFDPRDALGYVQAANYELHFWQPYLITVEREHGMRNTGVSFALYLTLKSFPAHYSSQHRPQWPSIQTLADMVAKGNRHRIMGRCERTDRPAIVGALEILEDHRIVWLKSRGAGTQVTYAFRVLEPLPLLTPTQVERLSQRLQQRHEAALARCQLNYHEWEQLTLPMLTQEEP
jgi:hypothetical protein